MSGHRRSGLPGRPGRAALRRACWTAEPRPERRPWCSAGAVPSAGVPARGAGLVTGDGSGLDIRVIETKVAWSGAQGQKGLLPARHIRRAFVRARAGLPYAVVVGLVPRLWTQDLEGVILGL